jgi:hypothetical protein
LGPNDANVSATLVCQLGRDLQANTEHICLRVDAREYDLSRRSRPTGKENLLY